MTEHYRDDLVTLHHADCLDVLRSLPDQSVHAVVTDPPYSLDFMGKAWDSHDTPLGFQQWCQEWAAECFRVLTPGGHLAAFGGTRTYHRLASGIEDAGFEIRDSIGAALMAWVYGSGMPKGQNVGKAIDRMAGAEREVVGRRGGRYSTPIRGLAAGDSIVGRGTNGTYDGGAITAPATEAARQWEGWNTSLKPSWEPIVVARRPIAERTVAANVLAYGTGAINIDATRVGMSDADRAIVDKRSGGEDQIRNGIYSDGAGGRPPGERFTSAPGGRWPANVVLSHSEKCEEECAEGCPVQELDRQSGILKSGDVKPYQRADRNYYSGGLPDSTSERRGDSGGASRFFPTFRYQAKAPTKERPKVNGISHPTTKPLALLGWLVDLLVSPGGTVLEPFAGSGTTVEACIDRGVKVIAIEREADYIPLIEHRIERANARKAEQTDQDPGLFEMGDAA